MDRAAPDRSPTGGWRRASSLNCWLWCAHSTQQPIRYRALPERSRSRPDRQQDGNLPRSSLWMRRKKHPAETVGTTLSVDVRPTITPRDTSTQGLIPLSLARCFRSQARPEGGKGAAMGTAMPSEGNSTMKTSEAPKPVIQRPPLPPAMKEQMLRLVRALAEADAQRDHDRKAKR